MKKKSIDLFGILFGFIIGCAIGYFVAISFHDTKENIIQTNTSTIGTVYLLELYKSDNEKETLNYLDKIHNEQLFGEIVHIGKIYYIYGNIGYTLEEVQAIKLEYEEKNIYGNIVSSYIQDLPSIYPKETIEYQFYSDAIYYLFQSLKKEKIVLKEQYYINPINVSLFSNLTLLVSIRNPKIEKELQLNTYKQLIEWFN